MTTHEIKPGISVDDVLFGASSQSLITAGYEEDESEFNEHLKWKTFKKNDEVNICVSDDDVVVCVACFKDCVLDGFCIIGQTPSDLISTLGHPDEIGEALWVSDDMQQTPYEYFSLGLQIWFESDRVVSVFCNAIILDS